MAWDRETGNLLNQLNDIDFNPISFDKVFLGQNLFFSEGSEAEMYFDNIVIEVTGEGIGNYCRTGCVLSVQWKCK